MLNTKFWIQSFGTTSAFAPNKIFLSDTSSVAVVNSIVTGPTGPLYGSLAATGGVYTYTRINTESYTGLFNPTVNTIINQPMTGLNNTFTTPGGNLVVKNDTNSPALAKLCAKAKLIDNNWGGSGPEPDKYWNGLFAKLKPYGAKLAVDKSGPFMYWGKFLIYKNYLLDYFCIYFLFVFRFLLLIKLLYLFHIVSKLFNSPFCFLWEYTVYLL